MSIPVDIVRKNWNHIETYIFESCAVLGCKKVVGNTV